MVILSVQYIREQPIPFPILNIFKFQYLKVLSTIGLKRYISDSQRNLAFKLFSEHQGGIYINIIVSQEHFLSLIRQLIVCASCLTFIRSTIADFSKIHQHILTKLNIYIDIHIIIISKIFLLIYTHIYICMLCMFINK